MTNNELRSRVQLGVSVLDKARPNWRECIDIHSFDMKLSGKCVLSQVYQTTYIGGLERIRSLGLLVSDPYEYGFHAHPDDYPALTLLWLEQIMVNKTYHWRVIYKNTAYVLVSNTNKEWPAAFTDKNTATGLAAQLNTSLKLLGIAELTTNEKFDRLAYGTTILVGKTTYRKVQSNETQMPLLLQLDNNQVFTVGSIINDNITFATL